MASEVTITEEAHGRGFRKVTFDWTAHTDGVVTKVETTGIYTGKVEVLVTDPDAGGDQPDDNYNLTVTDDEGYDILVGAGLLRDELVTETVLSASLGAVFESKIGPVISAAGSANKGVIVLLIR